MKAERVILSFIAVLVGLMVAGGTFYVYDNYFKNTPRSTSQVITVKPTTIPSPTSVPKNDFLTITEPNDESVLTTHSITVTGKATKGSIIVISTTSSDQVGIASNDGSYSLSTTIDNDTNPLYITAIFPDGTQQTLVRTLTYSTQQF